MEIKIHMVEFNKISNNYMAVIQNKQITRIFIKIQILLGKTLISNLTSVGKFLLTIVKINQDSLTIWYMEETHTIKVKDIM